jgi:hypothetical protein
MVRRSAQLIADFVIGSLLPDHQTAVASATNQSIQVDGTLSETVPCRGFLEIIHGVNVNRSLDPAVSIASLASVRSPGCHMDRTELARKHIQGWSPRACCTRLTRGLLTSSSDSYDLLGRPNGFSDSGSC